MVSWSQSKKTCFFDEPCSNGIALLQGHNSVYLVCRYLVFDFKKLEYISSAGLRILLACQKKMDMQGRMIVKNVNEDVREVLDITGFSDIITLE